MGSHRRRSRKWDRKRNLPIHVVHDQASQVLVEERRRKDRERKKRQRARARGEDPATPPSSPMPHDDDAPRLLPTPHHDSTGPSDAPTYPPSLDQSLTRVCLEPSSSHAPFFSCPSTSSTPFSSHATTPIGVGDSSPYFVHMDIRPSSTHTFHGVPHTRHENILESVHPSDPLEGTSIEGTLSPLPLPPIPSPSSPRPHVGDEEPPSPPSHELVPTGLHDTSRSSLLHSGHSLSRTASRARAQQIERRYFHGLDVPSRVQVLEELLRLPSMVQCVQAASIFSPRTRRTTSHVVQSLRTTYSRLVRRSTRDALAARHAIVRTITAPSIAGSIRSTSRLLAIPRRTLRDGVRWRIRLDVGDPEALWASSGRAPRSSRLLVPEIRELIGRFWEDHSRASPDFRRALRHRIDTGQYEEHGACFLEMTQTQLYLMFRSAHADIVIGQRSFEACKPWFIRSTSIHDTCLCRWHIQFELYYGVFGRLIGHAGVVPRTARDFVHHILCPRSEVDFYHRQACVQGTCISCGHLARVPFVSQDDDREEIVLWQQYQYDIRALPSGGQSRRLALCEREFIAAFCKQIYMYVQHAHRAKWQDRQFRQCLAHFPIGTVVSVVDFAENYTFVPQREIQSEYYFSDQVCVFYDYLFFDFHTH